MSCELSYSLLKNNQYYRDQESRAQQERKRNLLYLIEDYLRGENLAETLCCLQEEARLSEHYSLCDNVDLATILQEYEDYYQLRFNKQPKITKKLDTSHPIDKRSDREVKRSLARVKSAPPHKSASLPVKPEEVEFANIVITPVTKLAQHSPPPVRKLDVRDYPEEWKPFVEIITQEICTRDVNTHWTDVIGLDSAKRLLLEAIVYPTRYPELFCGLLSPWKAILLHGPPGTGKTLLARAVATQCTTTFFNISASSLVSKWRGESEKLVRVLFTLARKCAPSTIFLDELDALMSRRDGEEHEASRRLKAELLMQLDGLNTGEERVFLLATSNVPWDLDPAMLRRFEKRIFIDIPDLPAREAMLRHYLPPLVNDNPRLCSELDYPALSKAMEGYSGSDIKSVCKEVAMQRVRDTFELLERMNPGLTMTNTSLSGSMTNINNTGHGMTGSKNNHSHSNLNASVSGQSMNINMKNHSNNHSISSHSMTGMAQMKTHIKLKTITTQQVLSTLQKTKPSADYKQYYDKWQSEFGAM
ncbi:hypothetical protein M8J76_014806 [Diaphorina citri]|nr:hypothetical protein M8J75_010052 [Diaphorina citri]KAI5737573.1 hypothetical protein M8J76_014806 [Diaphorina citri]